MKSSLAAAAFGPALLNSKVNAAQQVAKPNIVLIYADDIGIGDLSCYGAKADLTPNVSKLAKESLVFDSAYASSATCTPSRYSMLTGQYAWRKKGTGILRGDAAMIINPGQGTLPGQLQKAGYKTGVVGKWHLGLGDGSGPINWNKDIKPGPMEIGFDYSFLMPATGDRVPCVYMEGHNVINLDPNDPIEVSYQKPFPGEKNGKDNRDELTMDWSHGHNMAVVNNVGRIGYMKGGKSALWNDREMADTFLAKASGFIEANKANPFFLYFATHDIHVPRLPHSRFKGKSGMGPRGDALVQFDFCVGAVVEKLEKLGIRKNTILIVTSDNGPVLDDGYKDNANELLGDHKPWAQYKGRKYTFWEAGTRMPFILSWPGKVKPGRTDAMVSQLDFTSSFAALTGTTVSGNEAPDSFNVLPALLGKSDTGREYVIEHAGRLAIRVGNWKLIEAAAPARNKKNGQPAQLYDLSKDIAETTDVAKQYPDKVKELTAKLNEVKAAVRTRP
ncbi:MAG: arylsulfatase [Phycisphaerae bacterium]|nr:arylsulfatase [Phycisphaerae bacterium]